jgi:phage terminase large subunit-like protein
MIPGNTIIRTTAKSGVAGGVDLVHVKHTSGGVSVLGFKAYDQGIDSFVGMAKHVNWLDEEAPELIYNEVLTRTLTTNGIQYVTFTPLMGYTPLIIGLAKDADYLADARPLAVLTPDEEEEVYEMQPDE